MQSQSGGKVDDPLHHLLPLRLIADDAASADLPLPNLKLGLHQRNHSPAWTQERNNRRENHRQGDKRNIDDGEIQQVLLAGSFGSYLSAASAIRIGLVPKLPIPRIVSAGNVAGEGAKMAVLSIQERHAGQALIDEIEYLELSDRADFNDRFVDELAFP